MLDATSPLSVTKPDGVTGSERYLQKLCNRSFLSLWSYPGVYRDQGMGSGEGKEVCDLLVVFREDVIIFSDKNCLFPDTGKLLLDWQRWFRNAIQKSANQVWGAERWIRAQPNRLFLDRACKQPFPIELPRPDQMRFHRIVVAHGTYERCRAHHGSRGSLVLRPDLAGKAHCAGACHPFVIGDLDPAKGFVHVLDDIALDVVMGHLDTIADFVGYLTKKEAFFRSGRLMLAASEEDLLEFYIAEINEQEEHDFVLPAGTTHAVIDAGQWERFRGSAAYARQKAANQVSYGWDALIEEFGKHILGGTSLAAGRFTVNEQQKAVRLLAQECRTARRALAQGYFGIVAKTPPTKRATRVMEPTRPNGPYYVIVVIPHPAGVPEERYREMRRDFLHAYCLVLKLRYPQAQDIVGIATETKDAVARSLDVMYLDASCWTADMQAEAERLQNEHGFLKKTGPVQRGTVLEYPGVG